MRFFLMTLLAGLLLACDSSTDNRTDVSPKPTSIATLTEISAAQWQQQADERFSADADAWRQALTRFEQTPDAQHLTALREALSQWYQRFASDYLLLASRACQQEGSVNRQAILSRLDSWPLYPGYLDALPEWPESGLISDPYLELTRQNLRRQHGATDPGEASLGFAALAVTLNGTTDTPKALSAFTGEEGPAARRRQYLKLAGEQLVADHQLLSLNRPLNGLALQCGLMGALAHWQQLSDSANEQEQGLLIPELSTSVNESALLDGVQTMDPDVIARWDQINPGIAGSIKQSEEEGWAPIKAWLTTVSITRQIPDR
ncbi:imelysin family protein [Alcanivorax sp.]|jgi:hypothetical protein|uniref:imelysin family protein n=1 Tax=Alcanivorax sp. TaxID=1872427 RepID=UPI0032D8FCF3